MRSVLVLRSNTLRTTRGITAFWNSGVTTGRSLSLRVVMMRSVLVLRSNTLRTLRTTRGISTGRSFSVRMMMLVRVLRSNTLRTTLRMTVVVMVRVLAWLLVMMMRSVLVLRSNTTGTALRIAGRSSFFLGGDSLRMRISMLGTTVMAVRPVRSFTAGRRLLGTTVRAVRPLVVLRSNILWGWSSSITTWMRSSLMLGSDSLRMRISLLGVMMRVVRPVRNFTAGGRLLGTTVRVVRPVRNSTAGGRLLGTTVRVVRPVRNFTAGGRLLGTTVRAVRLLVVLRSNILWGWSSSIATWMRSSLMLGSDSLRMRISRRSSLILRKDSLRMRMRVRMRMRGTVFTILAVIALIMTWWQTILVVSLDSIIRATIRRSSLVSGEYVFRLYIV